MAGNWTTVTFWATVPSDVSEVLITGELDAMGRWDLNSARPMTVCTSGGKTRMRYSVNLANIPASLGPGKEVQYKYIAKIDGRFYWEDGDNRKKVLKQLGQPEVDEPEFRSGDMEKRWIDLDPARARMLRPDPNSQASESRSDVPQRPPRKQISLGEPEAPKSETYYQNHHSHAYLGEAPPTPPSTCQEVDEFSEAQTDTLRYKQLAQADDDDTVETLGLDSSQPDVEAIVEKVVAASLPRVQKDLQAWLLAQQPAHKAEEEDGFQMVDHPRATDTTDAAAEVPSSRNLVPPEKPADQPRSTWGRLFGKASDTGRSTIPQDMAAMLEDIRSLRKSVEGLTEQRKEDVQRMDNADCRIQDINKLKQRLDNLERASAAAQANNCKEFDHVWKDINRFVDAQRQDSARLAELKEQVEELRKLELPTMKAQHEQSSSSLDYIFSWLYTPHKEGQPSLFESVIENFKTFEAHLKEHERSLADFRDQTKQALDKAQASHDDLGASVSDLKARLEATDLQELSSKVALFNKTAEDLLLFRGEVKQHQAKARVREEKADSDLKHVSGRVAQLAAKLDQEDLPGRLARIDQIAEDVASLQPRLDVLNNDSETKASKAEFDEHTRRFTTSLNQVITECQVLRQAVGGLANPENAEVLNHVLKYWDRQVQAVNRFRSMFPLGSEATVKDFQSRLREIDDYQNKVTSRLDLLDNQVAKVSSSQECFPQQTSSTTPAANAAATDKNPDKGLACSGYRTAEQPEVGFSEAPSSS